MQKTILSKLIYILLTAIILVLCLVGCGDKEKTDSTLIANPNSNTTEQAEGTQQTTDAAQSNYSTDGTTSQTSASIKQTETEANSPSSATYDRKLYGEISQKALQNKPQFLNLDEYQTHVFFLMHEIKGNTLSVPVITFITIYEKDGSAPYIGSYTRTNLQNIEDKTLIDELASQAHTYSDQYSNITGITYKTDTDSNFFIDDQVFFSLPEIPQDQLQNLPDFVRNRSNDDYSLGSDYAKLQQFLKDKGYSEITDQVVKE